MLNVRRKKDRGTHQNVTVVFSALWEGSDVSCFLAVFWNFQLLYTMSTAIIASSSNSSVSSPHLPKGRKRKSNTTTWPVWRPVAWGCCQDAQSCCSRAQSRCVLITRWWFSLFIHQTESRFEGVSFFTGTFLSFKEFVVLCLWGVVSAQRVGNG